MLTRIADSEFADRFSLPDWRILGARIEAHFLAPTYLGAIAFASSVAEAAEAANHHPDMVIRASRQVRITLSTHDVGGLSTYDASLAATISTLAAEHGLSAKPHVLSIVDIAIDAMDIDAVRPFWKALLAYREGAPPTLGAVVEDLVDPLGIGPDLWFQQMNEPRPQRNRIHIDVRVPHDVAEQRIADAIAAGGQLLTAEYARSFWVLADPEGNEACICTWQDRD
jgi:4a-hydroxytetrahydrobiopterin dehydratase